MHGRPLLVLDLEETLLLARDGDSGARYDFRAFQYRMSKRPYLQEFLLASFEWFEVAVWASSCCTRRVDPETREPYAMKNLDKVKRKGYSLGRVLMIDDSPEKLSRSWIGSELLVWRR